MTKKQKRETTINIILIAVVLLITFGLMPLLRVVLNTNYPIVVVSSGSMDPTYPTGDILFIKGIPAEEIEAGSHDERTGDVILYDSNGVWPVGEDQPIVHRVVGKFFDEEDGKYYFITQGDNPNNINTDPPGSSLEIPVPEDKVLGVVVGHIDKIGWIKIWLADTPGLSLILILGLSVLLVISLVQDFKENKEDSDDTKESGDPNISEADEKLESPLEAETSENSYDKT